jgi:hypothetical protein
MGKREERQNRRNRTASPLSPRSEEDSSEWFKQKELAGLLFPMTAMSAIARYSGDSA